MAAMHALIVEDDILLCELLAQLLTPAFLHVERAHNWAEAVTALNNDHEIKVVILDLCLPDSNVDTTISRIESIKRWPGKPRVVVMSSTYDYDHVARAQAAGCDAYFEKALISEFVPNIVGLIRQRFEAPPVLTMRLACAV